MRRSTGPVIAAIALLVATVALLVPVAPAATKPTVVRVAVAKGRPVGGIKRVSVKKGTVVRVVVTVDKANEVHLHGYDFERVVRPGKPAVMQFTARIPGRFELELHKPESLLLQLTVRP
jgi:hypothetical protein